MSAVRRPLGLLAGLVALAVSALVQVVTEGRVRPAAAAATGLGVGAAVVAAEVREAGRPNRAWHARIGAGPRPGGPLRGAFSGDRPDIPPGPPPGLAELVRVLPIGQTRGGDGLTIALLSLESYADGFLVHCRVLLAEERPRPSLDGPPFPPFDHPRPALEAGDDRGGEYRVWPASGGGGGREWRFSFHAAPALDPAARELRLTIPEVRRERLDHQRRRPVTADARRGPWTWTVGLTPAGG